MLLPTKHPHSICISDPTLRDGNHAHRHQLSLKTIEDYITQSQSAQIDIIEIGHGCGAGASSLHFGRLPFTEQQLYQTVQACRPQSAIGIHLIPGIGRIADLDLAMKYGVSVFRIASHCSESDATEYYIHYLKQCQQKVFGVLMMMHFADKDTLKFNAERMLSYGADGIILMDSAGYELPHTVYEKIHYLSTELDCLIGFHGHNNLHLAISNSLAAASAGASLIDATLMGFGAGAGNTPLEILCHLLTRYGYQTQIHLTQLNQLHEFFSQPDSEIHPPIASNSTLLSGLHGIFSGMVRAMDHAADIYHIDKNTLYELAGQKKLIAGQEDSIYCIARGLNHAKKNDGERRL